MRELQDNGDMDLLAQSAAGDEPDVVPDIDPDTKLPAETYLDYMLRMNIIDESEFLTRQRNLMKTLYPVYKDETDEIPRGIYWWLFSVVVYGVIAAAIVFVIYAMIWGYNSCREAGGDFFLCFPID